MSKPKYKQGKRICSMSEFNICESHWYKWNGKTIHRSFLISLQYRTLLNTINSGRLYIADPIDKTESKIQDDMETFEEIQNELRECINHAYRDRYEDMQTFGSNIKHLDKAIVLLNKLVKIHETGSEE